MSHGERSYPKSPQMKICDRTPQSPHLPARPNMKSGRNHPLGEEKNLIYYSHRQQPLLQSAEPSLNCHNHPCRASRHRLALQSLGKCAWLCPTAVDFLSIPGRSHHDLSCSRRTRQTPPYRPTLSLSINNRPNKRGRCLCLTPSGAAGQERMPRRVSCPESETVHKGNFR